MTRLPSYTVADRYTLLRSLARGGMGHLWVAQDRRLGREVALKFIANDGRDTVSVARFEREARLAARLRSAHVVQIYDYGLDDDEPFIAMELLIGETLARVIAREAPLAPNVVAEWLAQIGRGLKAMHEAGIVHRDIKPSNVFVTQEGDVRVLKVLDFGIAKCLHTSAEDVTRRDLLLGSPRYMSPEQIRGRPIDARSDLWSVAVVTYEMLTAHALFSSDHTGDSLARVCSGAIDPVSTWVPTLPEDFDRFFERALHRDPSRRFPDTDALVQAFHQACVRAMPADASNWPHESPTAIGRQGTTASLDGNESLATASLTPHRPTTVRHRRSLRWAIVVGSLAVVPVFLRQLRHLPAPEGVEPSNSGPHASLVAAQPSEPGTESDRGSPRSTPHVVETPPPAVTSTAPTESSAPATATVGAIEPTPSQRLAVPPRPLVVRHSTTAPRTAPSTTPRLPTSSSSTPPTVSSSSRRALDPFSGLPLTTP